MKIYSFPVLSAETIWSKPKSRFVDAFDPVKEPQFTAIGLSELTNEPINPSRLAFVGPSTAMTKLSPLLRVIGVGVFPAPELFINKTPGLMSLNVTKVLFSVANIDTKV